MKESAIEAAVVKWAVEHGWKVRKMVSPGEIGALDRIFHHEGITCYIEFKVSPNKPSAAQVKEMRELTAQSIPWLCAYSVDQGVSFLKELDRIRLDLS